MDSSRKKGRIRYHSESTDTKLGGAAADDASPHDPLTQQHTHNEKRNERNGATGQVPTQRVKYWKQRKPKHRHAHESHPPRPSTSPSYCLLTTVSDP
mmetsp:Transcript_29630/g.48893  ORF Transcript_29630/g.48893 Transcript_29630/m.48893 type:complete len:97 (-) Transcript_29630:681-971(-)